MLCTMEDLYLCHVPWKVECNAAKLPPFWISMWFCGLRPTRRIPNKARLPATLNAVAAEGTAIVLWEIEYKVTLQPCGMRTEDSRLMFDCNRICAVPFDLCI